MGATYGHLGPAWGIAKQAPRKKWPGAVDGGSGRPEKITVEGHGGVAEITYLSDRKAWGWTAHGGMGRAARCVGMPTHGHGSRFHET